MKVLVATRRQQGSEPDDFTWTVEGELVTPVISECSSPTCGCDRGFGGLASHLVTTTAEVADLDIDPGALREVVRSSLADQGWLRHLSDVDADDFVSEHVSAILAVAALMPVGTVVRRRREHVWADRWAA